MEEVKSWVVNIAAVAVLMIVLDLLMPEGRLRKFAQLLAGFVLMFVMINPVLNLLGKGVSASFAGWSDEAFLTSSQVRNTAEVLQRDRDRQILKLYRSMLLSDIQTRLESHEQVKKAEVDAVIYENAESEKYGQIRKLYIRLMMDNSQEPGSRQSVLAEIQKELQQVFMLDADAIIIQEVGKE